MPFVKVPSNLCCPLDLEIFTDPVFTKCGHSYSRKSIEKWFAVCDEKKNPLTSPATNEILTSRDLIPNHELQSRVSKFRESLLCGKALRAVIESGDIKKLESAKMLKSDLNALIEVRGAITTPLAMAISNNRMEVARWLLPHVEIDAPSSGGNTALHQACVAHWCELTQVIPMLIDWKANVNATNHGGSTPLHRAASFNPSFVPLLISKGGDVNAVDHAKKTPLFRAVQIETVKQLIAAGADLFAMDSAGRSVLFSTKNPKYFAELIGLMRTTGGANKLREACRYAEGKKTVTIATHTSASLIPGFIPIVSEIDLKTPDMFYDLWYGMVGAVDIGSYRAIRSRYRNRWKHPHPLIMTKNPYAQGIVECHVCKLVRITTISYHCTACQYDECEDCFNYKTGDSVPDAVECIKVLIKCGGLPFINGRGGQASSPLHILIQRMIVADSESDFISPTMRVVMTLICAGAFFSFPFPLSSPSVPFLNPLALFFSALPQPHGPARCEF